MPRRLTDPSPLSRRIAARRRNLGQSQAVAAWERGALPRSVELPMLADWLGQPLALVRQWWRAQRRARRERVRTMRGRGRVGEGIGQAAWHAGRYIGRSHR